jgi:hypothetical protein
MPNSQTHLAVVPRRFVNAKRQRNLIEQQEITLAVIENASGKGMSTAVFRSERPACYIPSYIQSFDELI